MQTEDARRLHAQGFIPSLDEDEQRFLKRVKSRLKWSQLLWKDDLNFKEEGLHLNKEHRFQESSLQDGGAPINDKFGCLPHWVPAYHSNQGLPFLTGGMAVELSSPNDSEQVFFQLRESFRNKDKWFIYPRQEILSHEMCHVVRFPLNSHRYEESLAYSISSSGFRRWLGGALLSPRDNLILLGGILSWVSVDVLSLMTLNLGAFSWILRFLLPIIVILGLIRNTNIRQELHSAQKNLTAIFPQNQSSKVLFCLNDQEIDWLSRHDSPDQIIQWWRNLAGFRGNFLRNVFLDVEDQTQNG